MPGMQQLLDDLRGAFGSYLIQEATAKQVNFAVDLIGKASNFAQIAPKYDLPVSSTDSQMKAAVKKLPTKQASGLIADLLQATGKAAGVSGAKAKKKATQKQVGFVLSLMAQLGHTNWRKLDVAKKFDKPPKTKDLLDMNMGEISVLISALKDALSSSYA